MFVSLKLCIRHQYPQCDGIGEVRPLGSITVSLGHEDGALVMVSMPFIKKETRALSPLPTFHLLCLPLSVSLFLRISAGRQQTD